ncbi:hypothetical protein [Paenibacillus sp. FSL L8-0708]|uniref:hypothetical protein n=1 Tax=Paenibacillus sp. FSL L8-0708 TaxID=2975311 RepID=UPI0030F7CA70
MSRYRKKPVVIDAFKWTGDPDQTEDPQWIIERIKMGQVSFANGLMYIKTLEGIMESQPGDYIIRGVKGEIYPCKPDIFEATYELVAGVDLAKEANDFDEEFSVVRDRIKEQRQQMAVAAPYRSR